jgi:osmoprotectant transport system ATP-binding protein
MYRNRYPAQLSGGQQQRVGVARALAADPPVLLMDEPFGAIDPVTRAHLQREFLDLQRRVRKTVVLVTHDIDEAVLLGDKIALLMEGGVLAQHGTPDELLTKPASPFVASFVGQDRGLKRLAVTPIDLSWLEPSGPDGDDVPHIAKSATLRDALAQALLSPDGVVMVVDEDGKPLGRLGLDRLVEAARPED